MVTCKRALFLVDEGQELVALAHIKERLDREMHVLLLLVIFLVNLNELTILQSCQVLLEHNLLGAEHIILLHQVDVLVIVNQ